MALSIDIPGGSIQLSGNPIIVNVTGGSAPVGSSGYMIMLRIDCTSNNLTGTPFIDAIPPDGDGAAKFDVSGYVDQPIPITFQYPLSGAVANHADQAFEITVESGERYIDSNGDLQESWSNDDEEITVLKGGIGERQLGYYNDNSSSFFADFIEGAKWLTWQPDGMKVSPYMPTKLWYISETAGTADLRVIGTYDDGSTDTHQESITFYDITGLIELNVSPDHLGLVLEPTGKQMVSFTAELVGVTPVRTYYIDWNYVETHTYLFFANSIGGVDCLWCSGHVEEGVQANLTTVSKPSNETSGIKDPTILVAGRTGSRTWKVNTGYKTRNELRGWRDLLLSAHVWYLFRGNIYPVIVRNADSLLWNSLQDLNSLTLELTEAHESRYY